METAEFDILYDDIYMPKSTVVDDASNAEIKYFDLEKNSEKTNDGIVFFAFRVTHGRKRRGGNIQRIVYFLALLGYREIVTCLRLFSNQV